MPVLLLWAVPTVIVVGGVGYYSASCTKSHTSWPGQISNSAQLLLEETP
jgi:cytochrome c-type biogenesis protein CcmH/NrfF